MQQITPEKQKIITGKKILLVQYSTTPKELVHAMITENNIVKSTALQETTSEVLIKDGSHQHEATVLLQHENERLMEQKFKKLKNMDLEEIFTGKYEANKSGREVWVLLQYNCTPYKVVYTIRNQRDTFCPGNSLYENVITYFRVEETVYQAIILHKSFTVEDLIKKLNLVKKFSTNLFVPGSNNLKIDFSSPAKSSPSRIGKYAFFERILRNKTL